MTELQQKSFWRQKIRECYLADESLTVRALQAGLNVDTNTWQQVAELARHLVNEVRAKTLAAGGINAFMHEYDLSSQEGLLLLCLAEALLRIPDSKTADQLIKDKLSQANWVQHVDQSQSMFVNAGTWGLMLTGKIIQLDENQLSDPGRFLSSMITRLSEPVVRAAMKEAMRIISQQFVMGDCIDKAISRVKTKPFQSYLFSFDMLGEAALCQADAKRYFNDYMKAILSVKELSDAHTEDERAVSVSIKLSALHPRYEIDQSSRVMQELVPNLVRLVAVAKENNVAITIDAEEADRLELMLDIFEAVFAQVESGWDGFGLAVQSYQKRALPVLRWLEALALEHGHKIPVRLVKGAYWDSEIKWSQERGLSEYPVFTRKEHTDISFLACAQYLLSSEAFYPQFASHNAHSLASIAIMAGDRQYETQRLHGMGDVLYQAFLQHEPSQLCRIYAPVGAHEDLLPYLVRRLLENGANTSFINRVSDAKVPVETLITDPIQGLAKLDTSVRSIPLPRNLYTGRINSAGINMADPGERQRIAERLTKYKKTVWDCGSVNRVEGQTPDTTPVRNPANVAQVVGKYFVGDEQTIDAVFHRAEQVFDLWAGQDYKHRATVLESVAGLIEQHSVELLALLVWEAGKCVRDGLAEIREAVDFCRYYALQLRQQFVPLTMRGATGEQNQLALYGRGVFLCISPWNFPLAIFIGQVTAALAAGNTVVAKPSSQTPLIAGLTVRLLHRAGVPKDVIQLLLVPGSIMALALQDDRLAGVAFTGSTLTAQVINRHLAERSGGIIPLLAETGGINTMIVDSSALPQQVVTDVMTSAFNSAGQRCSALRVLFIQDDVADGILELLQGAMQEMSIGDPADLTVDMGPVIDAAAQQNLLAHIKRLGQSAKLVAQCDLPNHCAPGYFVPPSVFEISDLSEVTEEIFGPVLHVIKFKQDQLPQIIDSINKTQYGLTLGVHSRLESTMHYVSGHANVGNIYINRNMIGATVGVQPFGGEGLSGTGPKAGGPHYLFAFATERVVTVNTAAIGGNAQLLSANPLR